MTPAEAQADLQAATDQLSRALTGLSEASARGASLLPGWTRGHVLAHLAQNAEGGTRLLTGARTGVPGRQYKSLEARRAGIDAAASLPAAQLVGDFRRTAEAFADAAAGMPAVAWQRVVHYADGTEPRAAVIVPARLAEVLIHHVDLGIGYRPSDWPAPFVSDLLSRIARSGSAGHRGLDSGAGLDGSAGVGLDGSVGAGAGQPGSSMADHELLAWLLGRPDGGTLTRQAAGSLPPPPPLPPFAVLYG